MSNYIEMDRGQILNLLRFCNKCVLSMSCNDIPYGIPMYYNYECNGGNIVIYMRSNKSGKKIDFLKCNERVSLLFQRQSWNRIESVVASGTATLEDTCDCSNQYTIKICVDEITGRKYCRNTI